MLAPAVRSQSRPHNLADRLAALRIASGTSPLPQSAVARLTWPANPVLWPAPAAHWLGRMPRRVPRLH